MVEYEELHQFIKKNSKIISLNINYKSDFNEYVYVINVSGVTHTFKLIVNEDLDVHLEYKSNLFRYSNDIQLELFELFNYKNIEYIDCYIMKKKIINNNFEILSMYEDYYDNDNDVLTCDRTIIKNQKPIKIKFTCHDDDITMEYNLETIVGFDEIIQKLDRLL
jgi:hypothetical protein